MGPFYCPNDQKVYIDLRFYKVLEQRLGAPGQFAQAYVIAHEVGHHVQQQLGIMDKVDALRGRSGGAQANALSVRVELQADCFAGVWAARSQKEKRLAPRARRHRDRAQRRGPDRRRHPAEEVAGNGRPESFTHGTSAQRVNWFKRGVEGGSVERCNTFEGRDL
jgi:predicted metalloprotease